MSYLSRNRRDFIKSSALVCAATALFPGKILGADSFMTKHSSDFGPMPAPAPDWLRNAVIAEIPTRGFNVSDYKNLRNWKSPYGDTTYRSIAAQLDYLKGMGFTVLCLYSVYNCSPRTNLYALRYTEPNPDMGTLEDVKYLINQAHARGMYVMSNTNHYGVTLDSPLLTEHPAWFLPHDQQISGQRVFDLNNDEARAYIIETHAWWCTDVGLDGWRIDLGSNTFRRSIWGEVMRKCAAKGKRIVLAPENRPLVGYIQGSGRHGHPPILDLENSGLLTASPSDPYRRDEISGHNIGERADPIKCTANNSPHPGPREGGFKVKGSRFIYGHNSRFAPMVPWMLVGETFNATHLALPALDYTPKLLHTYLDWTEVDTYKDVVEDFRKIGQIRAENQDLFHNNIAETKLINVPCTSTPSSPVKPYVRYLVGKKAGVVIGNDSVTEDVIFTLQIPLGALGLDGGPDVSVTDCWTNTTKRVPIRELSQYAVTVPKDRSAGGGVRVLLITADTGLL